MMSEEGGRGGERGDKGEVCLLSSPARYRQEHQEFLLPSLSPHLSFLAKEAEARWLAGAW